MGEPETERNAGLSAFAGALLELVGCEVCASVQAADGSTLVLLGGRLERAVEIPWRAEEVLAVMVGGGSIVVRGSEVEDVDRWSFRFEGVPCASVCVYLKDGTSLLIHQDIEPDCGA
jgi:hypothetical protein